MPKIQKLALYQREYPKLQAQLERLVQLVRTHDANIALIVLFGSAARLEPGPESDADVLLLYHDQAAFFTVGNGVNAQGSIAGSVLLTMAYQGDHPLEHPEQLSAWPLVAVISDSAASDLDADFLTNVARDGVEIYRQSGYTPPSQLAHLKNWDEWQDEVSKLLAAVG
jgi:predicted nucleotidyltransferase